jgi:hypothetical protein
MMASGVGVKFKKIAGNAMRGFGVWGPHGYGFRETMCRSGAIFRERKAAMRLGRVTCKVSLPFGLAILDHAAQNDSPHLKRVVWSRPISTQAMPCTLSQQAYLLQVLRNVPKLFSFTDREALS